MTGLSTRSRMAPNMLWCRHQAARAAKWWKRVHFPMILAHVSMGKLNFDQPTMLPNLPNLLDVFDLLLVAVQVVAPPVPWPPWQHWWPHGLWWPILAILEQHQRAPRFWASKMAKPSMQPLTGAPPGTNKAVLGPSGLLLPPPQSNTVFIVPDANKPPAAH